MGQCPCKEQLNTEKLPKTQVPQQGFRRAHVDRPGDRIAFEPAAALAHPRPATAIGFLKGHGGQELGMIAKTCEANANIGIFGDVMRVPTAELFQDMPAEKQRRSAERHGKLEPRQARQDDAKPSGIFDGETA